MCKSIKQEKTILQIENGIEMFAVDEKLYMTSIPVTLKKNTVYKIEFEMRTGYELKNDIVTIDIYGENYDHVEQKRKALLNKASDFVIIETDERLPENAIIRLYSATDVPIEKIRIYEVTV